MSRRSDYPPFCVGCKEPVVSQTAYKQLPEGERRSVRKRQGRGLCSRCYRKLFYKATHPPKPKPEPKRLPPCTDCDESLVTATRFKTLAVAEDGARFDPHLGEFVREHAGHGRCERCRARHVARERATAPTATLADFDGSVRACAKCKNATVPASVWEKLSPEQREGMKEYHARGFCQTCYKIENKAGRLPTVVSRSPGQCVVCKEPMIPGRRFYDMPEVERQGLVPHAAHGRCGKCNTAFRSNMKNLPELETLSDDQVPVEHLKVRRILRNGRRSEHARRVQSFHARAGRI